MLQTVKKSNNDILKDLIKTHNLDKTIICKLCGIGPSRLSQILNHQELTPRLIWAVQLLIDYKNQKKNLDDLQVLYPPSNNDIKDVPDGGQKNANNNRKKGRKTPTKNHQKQN